MGVMVNGFILFITFTLGITLFDSSFLYEFWIILILFLIPRDIFSLLAAHVAAFPFVVFTSGLSLTGRLCTCLFSLGVKNIVIICWTWLFVFCLSLLAGFLAALIYMSSIFCVLVVFVGLGLFTFLIWVRV